MHHDARPLRAEHLLRISQVVLHVFSHGIMVRQDAENADHTDDMPPATKSLVIPSSQGAWFTVCSKRRRIQITPRKVPKV